MDRIAHPSRGGIARSRAHHARSFCVATEIAGCLAGGIVPGVVGRGRAADRQPAQSGKPTIWFRDTGSADRAYKPRFGRIYTGTVARPVPATARAFLANSRCIERQPGAAYSIR